MKLHILILTALLCCPALVVENGWGANRALLIGVADYRNVSDLPGNAHDTGIMKTIVLALGYKEQEIKVLTDSKAGLANIEQQIENWLVQGTGPNDRALLYFSGHGTQIKDLNADEDDGADEALVPWDAVFGEDDTLLSDDRLSRLLSKIPARETFVFVDACHSGTATKGISLFDDALKVKYLPWPGGVPTSKGNFEVSPPHGEPQGASDLTALAACRDDEEAISGPKGSLFTLGLGSAVAASTSDHLTLDMVRETAAQYIADALQNRPSLVFNPTIGGDTALAGKNLFIQPTGSDSGAESRPGVRSKLWQEMAGFAGEADYTLQVKVNKQRYLIGDQMEISVDVITSGYLNIINLGAADDVATVLFPNRFVKDNFIVGGQTINLPGNGGKFKLTAQPPASDTLIVVFHTEEPLNLWQDGIPDTKSIFRRFGLKEMRAFGVEAASPEPTGTSIGAATLVTEIVSD